MSEVVFLSVDRDVLPGEVLPLLKAHCRIEFTRDDIYLKGVASRSIDLFERITGTSIFPRLYDWLPTLDEGSLVGTAWRWPGPVVPFTGFTAMDGTTDVASQYKIAAATSELIGPSWLVRKDGKPDAVPTLTATSGFKTADEIPPGVLDFVLRAGAYMYEFREASLMPGVDMLAYGNSLLAGQWVPRA